MERKIYSDVVIDRLRRFDLRWLIHKAYIYAFLKAERYLKTGYAPAPLACGLVVTENCNLRCPMCVLPYRFMKEPTNQPINVWRRVIDNLHDLGVGGIGISGGEPETRNDLLELIAYAGRKNTTVSLNSNMMLLTDEKIEKLVKSPLDNINVSVDSGRDDINDKLRGGKNVLSKVLDRISAVSLARKRHKKKFSTIVVAALSDMNLDDLDILFEKVSKSGADRIGFVPLHDIRDGKTYIVKLKKAQPNIYDLLVKLSIKHKLPLENSSKYLKGFYNVMSGGVPKEHCNTGYTHLVIGTDLKIYRCSPYMNSGRYLFKWDPAKVSLRELWNSPEWRKDRLMALECKECYWGCHAEVNHLISM
jgi:MoaA/NifB/PqqE/SkfB family radical SAM enzyme